MKRLRDINKLFNIGAYEWAFHVEENLRNGTYKQPFEYMVFSQVTGKTYTWFYMPNTVEQRLANGEIVLQIATDANILLDYSQLEKRDMMLANRCTSKINEYSAFLGEQCPKPWRSGMVTHGIKDETDRFRTGLCLYYYLISAGHYKGWND